MPTLQTNLLAVSIRPSASGILFSSARRSRTGEAAKGRSAATKTGRSLFEYRAHRISIHRDRHFLQDWECETCETFQEEYAMSLNFHIDHPFNVVQPEKARLS